MDETAITALADASTLAGLDRLATAYGRSRDWLIATALKKYVEEELAFCDFIQEGEDAIAGGDYVTHEELVKRIRTRLQAKRAA